MNKPDEIDENTPSPENQRGKIKHRITALLEKLEKIQGLALIVAAIALGGDLYWKIKHEYPALKDERTAQAAEREDAAVSREMQAWAHLSRKDYGIDGYDTAIQYLLDRRGELSGLDLSCEAFGGDSSKQGNPRTPMTTAQCSPTLKFRGWTIKGNIDDMLLTETIEREKIKILTNLNMSGITLELTSFETISLVAPNFSYSRLVDTEIDESSLILPKFKHTEIRDFSFYNTQLIAAFFEGAQIVNVDMSRVDCDVCDFKDVHFFNVNLSDAIIPNPKNLTQDQLNRTVWAWSDQPPILPDNYDPITLCDSRLRPYQAPPNDKRYSGELPEGCNLWQWADWPVQNNKLQSIWSCDPTGRDAYYALSVIDRPDYPASCPISR